MTHFVFDTCHHLLWYKSTIHYGHYVNPQYIMSIMYLTTMRAHEIMYCRFTKLCKNHKTFMKRTKCPWWLYKPIIIMNTSIFWVTVSTLWTLWQYQWMYQNWFWHKVLQNQLSFWATSHCLYGKYKYWWQHFENNYTRCQRSLKTKIHKKKRVLASFIQCEEGTQRASASGIGWVRTQDLRFQSWAGLSAALLASHKIGYMYGWFISYTFFKTKSRTKMYICAMTCHGVAIG